MADLLNIGLSALLAQQRALTTTANNIANASTPGYSRQRVELARAASGAPRQRLRRHGRRRRADAASVRQPPRPSKCARLPAVFTAPMRSSRSPESLDDMLAGTETGLTATLQAFANSLQDVANDPSSTSSRQALLSEARNLVARFDAMDQRLTELAGETRTRMTAAADRITALGADLAEINRQLIAAGTATGRPAP